MTDNFNTSLSDINIASRPKKISEEIDINNKINNLDLMNVYS